MYGQKFYISPRSFTSTAYFQKTSGDASFKPKLFNKVSTVESRLKRNSTKPTPLLAESSTTSRMRAAITFGLVYAFLVSCKHLYHLSHFFIASSGFLAGVIASLAGRVIIERISSTVFPWKAGIWNSSARRLILSGLWAQSVWIWISASGGTGCYCKVDVIWSGFNFW